MNQTICTSVFSDHTAWVAYFAIHETTLFSGAGGKDNLLCGRDFSREECQPLAFKGHKNHVSSLKVMGERLFTATSGLLGREKDILVWDLKTGELTGTLCDHSKRINCLRMSEERLISASDDATIRIWANQEEATRSIQLLEGHKGSINSLKVRNGVAYSGSTDEIRSWDLASGKERGLFKGDLYAVEYLAFYEDLLLSGSWDCPVRLWDSRTGDSVKAFTTEKAVEECKVVGHTIFIRHYNEPKLSIFDLRNEAEPIKFIQHELPITCLSATEEFVVSSDEGPEITVWSAKSFERVATLEGHTKYVSCLKRFDHSIVSGSYDTTVRIWDLNHL